MEPFIDPRIARTGALLGALSATCTFAINARGASVNSGLADELGTRPFAVPHVVQWLPSGSRASRRMFARAGSRDQTSTRIAAMTQAADRIAKLPYVWGGGHGSFDATGYDCSGSVSYVLHGGGLLSAPEDSSGLESFGAPGPGRHVTIYADAEHAWMTIDRRRFDTIAFQETGTRWSASLGSEAGYVVRHPRGF